MSGTCWRCEGRGYVRNCDIEDGMMTGRDTCPTCEGTGRVTLAQLQAEFERLRRIFAGLRPA